jgi:hypothetical protein
MDGYGLENRALKMFIDCNVILLACKPVLFEAVRLVSSMGYPLVLSLTRALRTALRHLIPCSDLTSRGTP